MLRFGSDGAVVGVDGGKPTSRGLPPAGRQCRQPVPSATCSRAQAPRVEGLGAAVRSEWGEGAYRRRFWGDGETALWAGQTGLWGTLEMRSSEGVRFWVCFAVRELRSLEFGRSKFGACGLWRLGLGCLGARSWGGKPGAGNRGRETGGGAACPFKPAFNAGLFVVSYVSIVLFMPPILHLATASHMRQPTMCARLEYPSKIPAGTRYRS